MDVLVVDHPLARARLSTMRDARTDNAAFRAALRELTLMLIYEATRTLPTEQVPDAHPGRPDRRATRLPNPPLLVPVLRAGLGMADQAHALIPEAQMGFVGLARDEETCCRRRTWSRCRNRWPGGRSTCSTRCSPPAARWCTPSSCSTGRGATDVTAICVLAAPEGLARAGAAAALPVRVVTASVDERLNDSGYIVPGARRRGRPPVRRRVGRVPA